MIITAAMLLATAAGAQDHVTVRHHRVQEDPEASLLSDAEINLEKGDYSGAEPQLKKYLEAHPESYLAWYDLGYAYHALHRREESIAAYRKSVQAKPDLFESNFNLGLALADAGDSDAAKYLSAATVLKPAADTTRNLKRAWMTLAQVLETAKPDEALNAFQQAAVLDPKDPEPHLAAGSLLEKQKRPADAEKEYQQALTLTPDSADALTALTNLYTEQRRFSDAESLLRKLTALHPDNAGSHLQLGRMLAIAGKNDDAIAEMEAGLKLDPADVKGQRDLADLYADSKKYAQAESLYVSLLASQPKDAALHYGLGRVLLKEKKFPAAEQELVKAVQLQPGMGAVYGELAIVANENKNYPMVIKAVDLRARYEPEIPMTFFLRATAYDHLRDIKQATNNYHRFLEVAGGKYPDQEWQARHRLITLEPKK